MAKYGVRIYPLDAKTILIKQTIKNAKGQYVIDTLPDGTHREKHVNSLDDIEIAKAVRGALIGKR